MDSKYAPHDHESILYAFWEKKGYLSPKGGKPFTVLMPPPNANDPLHAGHGMYVVDDIIVRFKRLQGYASLWIPGTDHAGFETQFVFEKYLAKQGKSRMDFDRKTLYNNIFAYVKGNAHTIVSQLKRLGFLACWDRSVFSLDQRVIDKVYKTFSQMIHDGLVYRDSYIVNYCTHCGTSLADLEVKYVERNDPLYYLKYGPFVLATVRPETKFGDTAVAVNPKDKRYIKWIGKEIEVEGLLGNFKINVIADSYVDPKFGTGVVKITPAHDPNDFAIGKKHGLKIISIITLEGTLSSDTGKYAGMKVGRARDEVVNDLQARGLLEKIDSTYVHSVSTCYRCGHDLEPLVVPNWFIRVESLKEKAKRAVEKNKVTFFPKKYKKQILDWYTVMHDWPISRQVVWGIRIPVWYDAHKYATHLFVVWIDDKKQQHRGHVADFISRGITIAEIEQGLQKLIVPTDCNIQFVVSDKKPKGNYLPETDTFDTWFSSNQWPLVTLKEDEMGTRFPTDFMGTLSDILKSWISRMIMLSLYDRGEIPFRIVYLWSMVVDKKGIKMSKSKGNVINPLDMVEKYGADAFRASLLFGVGEGGKVILAEEKIVAMRNFMNKIWNIGRFIAMAKQQNGPVSPTQPGGEIKIYSGRDTQKKLKQLDKESKDLYKSVVNYMDTFKFSRAFDSLYEFIWHRFADYFLEIFKEEVRNGEKEASQHLEDVYLHLIVLLHPFIPFVTEAIWQEYFGKEASILDSGRRFIPQK